jgi:hypothetical protein
MSKEQEMPYWTHDTSLFTGSFRSFGRGEPVLVRGKLHMASAPYSKTDLDLSIVPITQKRGVSTYVHLKAYVLVPDITLTIGLYTKPKQSADRAPAIGEVIGATENPKMREHEIGNGQAWYYPQDRLIELWECDFFPPYREAPIHQDQNMMGLWDGFEKFLLSQFPKAEQIATTYADSQHDTVQYQQFLLAHELRNEMVEELRPDLMSESRGKGTPH